LEGEGPLLLSLEVNQIFEQVGDGRLEVGMLVMDRNRPAPVLTARFTEGRSEQL
jgi:hypothetical protein